MAPATLKGSDVGDRVVDAYRHASHLSHQAKLLKSVAEDAIEDSVHAARRAMKTATRRAEEGFGDLKDEAVHRVKRQPLMAVGLAAGVGLMLGMALGFFGGRIAPRK
jgi:ElaB/YqjD/DUF883 family membrane-anchored ribosome-binding protein